MSRDKSPFFTQNFYHISWEQWPISTKFVCILFAQCCMADHSVGAWDESNESEASQALMFCFDNAFPEKSCFVVDLVPLSSLHIFVFLNATATEWNLPQQRKCSFFQFPCSPLRRNQRRQGVKEFMIAKGTV